MWKTRKRRWASWTLSLFPTVLVAQGEQPVFLGPLLPQIGVLQRMERFVSDGAAPLPAGDAAHELLRNTRRVLAERAL